MATSAEYQKIVLDVFKDVIQEYQFDVQVPAWDVVILSNDKCILRLIYDTGIVSPDFVDPKEKAEREKIKRADGWPSGYPVYEVTSVWKFLYPNDRMTFKDSYDAEVQTKAIKQLILERLTNVLNGDFSWLSAYKESNKRKS